ncbi:MAG TPA: hypothetical protein VGF82_17350 [Terracidiphilus sp.]
MNLLESLRKGFRFFLMSFGISSPTKKPAGSAAKALADNPEPNTSSRESKP